jgi:CxxC-x17-CxxC domain-containing protein
LAFTDKRVRCIDCGEWFTWTAGEQAFFAEKELHHEPRRCRACKGRDSGRPARPPSELVADAVCSACGRPTTVPFKPVPGRPVFCRACYQHRRGRAGSPA